MTERSQNSMTKLQQVIVIRKDLNMIQYYDEDRWDLADGSLAESFKEFYKLEDK